MTIKCRSNAKANAENCNPVDYIYYICFGLPNGVGYFPYNLKTLDLTQQRFNESLESFSCGHVLQVALIVCLFVCCLVVFMCNQKKQLKNDII